MADQQEDEPRPRASPDSERLLTTSGDDLTASRTMGIVNFEFGSNLYISVKHSCEKKSNGIFASSASVCKENIHQK